MNREGQAADGGIEASVKSFSVTISYVAFIFKVSTSILNYSKSQIKVLRISNSVESVFQLPAGHKRDTGRPPNNKNIENN